LECFFEAQSFKISISSGQVSKIQFLHWKAMLSHCREISIAQNFHPKQWCLIRDILKLKAFGRKSLPAKAIVFLPQMFFVAIADGHRHQSRSAFSL
jgi:hypothetical protein